MWFNISELVHKNTEAFMCDLYCMHDMTHTFTYSLLQGSYRDYISLDDEVKQLVSHITMMVLQNADECQVLIATDSYKLSISITALTLYERCWWNIFTYFLATSIKTCNEYLQNNLQCSLFLDSIFSLVSTHTWTHMHIYTSWLQSIKYASAWVHTKIYI